MTGYAEITERCHNLTEWGAFQGLWSPALFCLSVTLSLKSRCRGTYLAMIMNRNPPSGMSLRAFPWIRDFRAIQVDDVIIGLALVSHCSISDFVFIFPPNGLGVTHATRAPVSPCFMPLDKFSVRGGPRHALSFSGSGPEPVWYGTLHELPLTSLCIRPGLPFPLDQTLVSRTIWSAPTVVRRKK